MVLSIFLARKPFNTFPLKIGRSKIWKLESVDFGEKCKDEGTKRVFWDFHGT